jgi:microcystin-dependent protein
MILACLFALLLSSSLLKAQQDEGIIPFNTILMNQDNSIDTVLNTISFAVVYADNINDIIWSTANLSPADVNFNRGQLSYNIGPITNGDLSRKMKIRMEADGVFTYYPFTPYSLQSKAVVGEAPVGSIMAYIGDGNTFTNLEKQGWFLCDGRAISSLNGLTNTEKNQLQTILGTGGYLSSNLPDLRGYFLRGADKGSGNDPDHAARAGVNPKIGSPQASQNLAHSHSMTSVPSSVTGIQAGTGSTQSFFSSTSNRTTSSDGGTESRPKNITVNWIIRVK